MELIQRFPEELIQDTKLREMVENSYTASATKALAFVIQRVGFRQPTDDDHLAILLSACNYSRRVSLIRFLFEHFEMNRLMLDNLRGCLAHDGDLATLVYYNFLTVDGDEEEPREKRPFVRLRRGRSNTNLTRAYEQWRDGTISSFTRTEANLDAYQRISAELAEIFGLTEIERNVAVAIYALSLVSMRREVYIPNSLRSTTDAISRITGLPSEKVEKTINPRGRLARFRLINPTSDDPTSFSLTIEPLLWSLFRGHITKEGLTENIKLIDTANFSLGSFPLASNDRTTLRDLISSPKPRHILIYGEPGTGKTELVRSVIRAERKKAYWIGAVEKGVDGDDANRHSLFDVAVSMADERGVILVVDEADQILNTESLFGSSGKARLVRMFDETPVTTVWIVNDADAIHNAIVRRFHFHLRFEPPRKEVRFQRLSILLREARISLPRAERRRIATNYDVSIASLSRAMETAVEALTVQNDESQPVIDRLEQTLAYEHEFIHGAKPLSKYSPRRIGSGTQFLKEALNTSVPVERLAASVTRFFEAQEREGGSSRHLNMLFAGPSGTGKTAFARELGRIVGREVLVVTGADLLGPHVGETETAIRNMFAVATNQNAIILLDEAENLLQSRTNARMGYERQQTNEFLSQLERHGTVFIATTNEKSILDSAMNRRFSVKVDFAPPAMEHRVHLYRAYFTLAHRRLTPTLVARIQLLRGLTAGHIRTVYDRLQFFIDDQITHEEIITEIGTEIVASLNDRSESVVLGFSA
jgi:SpoVK/Ycf46/Vps4 family AAA+-type ATPase